jgi:hypothetical protein
VICAPKRARLRESQAAADRPAWISVKTLFIEMIGRRIMLVCFFTFINYQETDHE